MTRKSSAAAKITDPALDLAGLKLRLAETIARRATKHRSPADREIYLQRQRPAMRADARAAGHYECTRFCGPPPRLIRPASASSTP